MLGRTDSHFGRIDLGVSLIVFQKIAIGPNGTFVLIQGEMILRFQKSHITDVLMLGMGSEELAAELQAGIKIFCLIFGRCNKINDFEIKKLIILAEGERDLNFGPSIIENGNFL